MFKTLSSRTITRLSNLRAIVFWKRNSLLAPPCKFCKFESVEMPNVNGRMKYYPVWITCSNPAWGGPANDGCGWGNV